MTQPVPLAEIWRGPLLESYHLGHAVICDGAGKIVESWGDPGAMIYPRSSSKMIQALPLLTSGAADRYGLTPAQLALACASHNGDGVHVDGVRAWLGQLGLTDDAFRCGAHLPMGEDSKHAMIRADETPCQVHNNCSGKHAGFLTLSAYMGAGPEYTEIDHPVQAACRAAFEEVTQETSPGYCIDGCSAPNFASTLHGLARAMGWFASASRRSDRASAAAQRLTEAMMLHPDLVAGETRACTELMRAVQGKAALKTGAEAVYVAILPELDRGIALKVIDGGTRGAECAIAALLVRLGVLDPAHPAAAKFMTPTLRSWRGLEAGSIRPAPGLTSR